MITTTAMRQLIAAVLDKDADSATRALLGLGVIDFIDIREIPAEWTSRLSSLPRSQEADRVRDLRRRLDAFIHTAGLSPAEMLRGEELPSRAVDLGEVERKLDDIEGRIRRVRDQQKDVQDKILQLQELSRQLPQQQKISPELIRGGHAYISVHVGSVPGDSQSSFEEALRDFPAVYLPQAGEEGDIDFLITLKRDRDRVQKLLDKYGWQDLSLIHI